MSVHRRIALIARVVSAGWVAGCAGEPSPLHDAAQHVSASSCPDGEHQSPIDLPASAAHEKLPALVFDYRDSFVAMTNTGGTIKYDYEPGSRMSLGPASYALQEFHFHAPSEHTVAGQRAPMELHLVHADDDGQLLVVGVLIEEGAHHPMFDLARWSDLPVDPAQRVESDAARYNARELLPGGPTFRYTGSLTAPPCTSDVTWIVFQERLELHAEQIALFTALYDGNFRAAQPLDGRAISFGE